MAPGPGATVGAPGRRGCITHHTWTSPQDHGHPQGAPWPSSCSRGRWRGSGGSHQPQVWREGLGGDEGRNIKPTSLLRLMAASCASPAAATAAGGLRSTPPMLGGLRGCPGMMRGASRRAGCAPGPPQWPKGRGATFCTHAVLIKKKQS